jgi:hypothetical protein
VTVEAACDCGAVRLQIAEAPTDINDCPCSWCQRVGALWAYYKKDAVRLVCEPGATSVYLRGPKRLAFHSCNICGLTTHWSHRDPSRENMGVNARMMPEAVWRAAKLHHGMD